ncbi:hypothetical protein ACC771_15180, partial [Rhizobium ruizarguesonis]
SFLARNLVKPGRQRRGHPVIVHRTFEVGLRLVHQAIKDDPGGNSRWIAGLYLMTEEDEADLQADTASKTETDE